MAASVPRWPFVSQIRLVDTHVCSTSHMDLANVTILQEHVVSPKSRKEGQGKMGIHLDK